MNRKILASMSIFLFTVAGPLSAQAETKKTAPTSQKQEQAKADDKELMDLANSKGCFACHQVDRKVIGPAWLEVSQKYDQKDIPYLVNKIIEGGTGVWGNVPMPPNRGIVTEEEAKKLASWIISLKNKKK